MQTPKIFLSYSRDDAEFAQNLAVKLRDAGANLWIDQLDIPAGSRWDVEVGKALETSECLLVVLSKTSVESNNVLDEVSYALDSNRRVVPIVIDDCVIPFRLRRLQYVDFSKNFERAFEKLLKSLNQGNTKQHEINISTPIESETVKVPVAENTFIQSEEGHQSQEEELNKGKTDAPKSSLTKNIIIVVLIIAVAALIFFIQKSGSQKEEKYGIITDTSGQRPGDKETTFGKDTISGIDKPKPPITEPDNPKKDDPVIQPATLIINRGQFVFKTTNDARERGDVFISIAQSGKTVWKEKIPAQTPWAPLSKYNFDMPVNVKVLQGPALIVTLSLCNPRGPNISWSGEAVAVFFQSNKTKKAFKSAFTLSTAKGNGTPKCDEISLARSVQNISVKASGEKALKVQ